MSDAIVRSATGCTRATRPGAPSSRGAGAGGTRRTLTREGTVFKKKNKMKFERASGEARTLPLATRFTHESGRAELEAIMSIVRARGSFPTSRPVRAETCDPPVVVVNSADEKKPAPSQLRGCPDPRVSASASRSSVGPRIPGSELGADTRTESRISPELPIRFEVPNSNYAKSRSNRNLTPVGNLLLFLKIRTKSNTPKNNSRQRRT